MKNINELKQIIKNSIFDTKIYQSTIGANVLIERWSTDLEKRKCSKDKMLLKG